MPYANIILTCGLRPYSSFYIYNGLRPAAWSLCIYKKSKGDRGALPLDPVLIISRMSKPFYWRRHWCNSVNRNSHTFGCMSRHPIVSDDAAVLSIQSDCQCMVAFLRPSYAIRWWCVSPQPCRIRGKVTGDRIGTTFSWSSHCNVSFYPLWFFNIRIEIIYLDQLVTE